MATYKAPKPTKQQLSQAAARSKGQIPMNTTAKQLRGTTKIIAAAATMLPVGRIAAGAATVAKAAKVEGVVAKAAAAAKTAQIAKNSVKIRYNKQAIENAIKDSQLKTKRSDMRPPTKPPFDKAKYLAKRAEKDIAIRQRNFNK